MTDREGRFTLIAPETIHRVTVFHELARPHRIGKPAGGGHREDVARDDDPLHAVARHDLGAALPGRRRSTRGATESCSARCAAADARTRLAGAQVRVSWDFSARSAIGQSARDRSDAEDRLRRARTTRAARRRATTCTSPAIRRRFGRARVTVPGDTLPLRRVDLVLGEIGKSATIRGVVRDPRHAPLAGASIDVDGVDATVKDGRKRPFHGAGRADGLAHHRRQGARVRAALPADRGSRKAERRNPGRNARGRAARREHHRPAERVAAAARLRAAQARRVRNIQGLDGDRETHVDSLDLPGDPVAGHHRHRRDVILAVHAHPVDHQQPRSAGAPRTSTSTENPPTRAY